MYFVLFVHSLTCGDCPGAVAYWMLRAFWSGFHGCRFEAPSRCPCRLVAVWHDMWVSGYDCSVERFETLGV